MNFFYLLFEHLFLEIVFPSPATNVPPSKKDNSNFYVKADTYSKYIRPWLKFLFLFIYGNFNQHVSTLIFQL